MIFSDSRATRLLGALIVVATLLATAGALFLDRSMFVDAYEVVVEFRDAAGMEPGDGVLVAGVRAGVVTDVELAPDRSGVEITVQVDRAVELPADAVARIHVDTLLGTKTVRLDVADDADWSTTLADGGRITLLDDQGVPRTETPIELVELQDVGVELIDELDTMALNDLLASVTTITDGARDDLAAITGGFGDVFAAVDAREAELRSLLASSAELSAVLARRDTELVAALDDAATVSATLADRRQELVGLLEATVGASTELSTLLDRNQDGLDTAVEQLRIALEVVDAHQVDLAHALAYAASGIEGFSQIGYTGPDLQPLPWTTTAAVGAGPLTNGGFSACGVFDRALDIMLGPDPVPCDERDTPVTQESDDEVQGTSGVVGQLLRPHLVGGGA